MNLVLNVFRRCLRRWDVLVGVIRSLFNGMSMVIMRLICIGLLLGNVVRMRFLSMRLRNLDDRLGWNVLNGLNAMVMVTLNRLEKWIDPEALKRYSRKMVEIS